MTPKGVSVRNVIVFGECGVGKSSLVNLVVGSSAAKTSPDADPCTVHNKDYEVNIRGETFKIWDTVGLDGGSLGAMRAALAEWSLKRFLRSFLKKDDLSLLVYCVRGSRATRALVRHYEKIHLQTCNSTVPMVIVVTALENASGDMDSWWQRNEGDLSKYGMSFIGHACVTTVGDDTHDTETVRARRARSQEIVRDLIFNHSHTSERGEDGLILPADSEKPPGGNWLWQRVRNVGRHR
ncbi:hypothetical protein BU15DRAFT_71365 [Melanogaster broomeanus]|nr:hypothetical protein BU15DRAFT_71365 [Melanogaster broomeanus]